MPAVVATLGLQVNRQYTSIVSLYVVLLLLAMAAVAALSRRLPELVITGSLGLYVAGYFWPAVFNLPALPGYAGGSELGNVAAVVRRRAADRLVSAGIRWTVTSSSASR